MRQVFFDTETTGLSPETGDRVVEIGCVEMIDRRLTGDNKHFHLNPERKEQRRGAAHPRPDRRVPGHPAGVCGHCR